MNLGYVWVLKWNRNKSTCHERWFPLFATVSCVLNGAELKLCPCFFCGMGISVNCLNPCATVNCVLNGATSSVIRLCHLISSQKLPVSKEQTSGWCLERDWSRSLLAIKVYVAVGVQFFCFFIRSISIVCFKAFELVWNGVTQVATWIRNLGVFPQNNQQKPF